MLEIQAVVFMYVELFLYHKLEIFLTGLTRRYGLGACAKKIVIYEDFFNS